ncbi:MAG: efflux RND transporter periplasmic adaptor subunit [Verrucomicrobia bacterium]|nr:efflux RND transporter periplasmic adaptor subunit [Verrucomicrobiota bacterium]MBV8484471.1 efflux RND transporter periplasmic adaptor subunit [Verrucomicrobiota bacterium]
MKKRRLSGVSNLSFVVLVTLAILAGALFVLWPAYQNPTSRMYTSALGYLRVQRLLRIGFQAEAVQPVLHDFNDPVLGDGIMEANFYNVPIVPTAYISDLKVEAGDEVKPGQILADLDTTLAKLNLSSGELALANAKAEEQRVAAGSVNLLSSERPDQTQVDLDGLYRQVQQAQQLVSMYSELEKDGAGAKLQLLTAQMQLSTVQTNYEVAKLNVAMSVAGLPQSKQIAENAVKDAENQLQQRQEAFKYYQITAPTSGIVDRVLVRPGEYNQSPGNVGFIIASDLWFEASVDQRAIGEIQEGMDAVVNLEAYAGRSFPAKIKRVVPIVTFDAGGPETTTPVRPLGTGTPEWPATFRVRLEVQTDGLKLRPGMTGFVKIDCAHKSVLAVPREAVSSLSAGQGVVRVVDEQGHIRTTCVHFGQVDDQYVEITAGLNRSDWVLSTNPRYLRDDDKINVNRVLAAKQ